MGYESSQRQEGRVLLSISRRGHFEKKQNAIGVVEEHLKDPNAALDKALKSVPELARGFVETKQQ